MVRKIVLALAITVIISSCGNADKDARKSAKNVYESAPIRSLTDSINQFPNNPDLRIRRALALSQMNEHEKATPDYQKTWELTGDENVLLSYASNLILAQDLPGSVKLLETGARKFPDNAEFSRRLAEINLQRGKNNDALAEFDNMIQSDSTNFEAWYEKGMLLARMKDTAAAIKALETSFSLMPINYTGMALANMYVALKNPRALQICDILLARDSSKTQTEPVYMKGIYYADAKQYDNAVKAFDECIRRDWKMTDAYIEKGIILYERKRYEDALKLFNMTTTVSNTDADAYYWLGRCYEATGNINDAVTNYERALSLDNTFTEARTALRRLSG